MSAYYNEHDPICAEWLRNLIAAGLLPDGEVDERDIRDVTPAELVRFTQCHFFAGIGLWPAALRRAGWPDDRPIWTGSCPCQPFSAAGAGAGFDDERHLWPHWYWLIWNCRPPVVAGEQVAGKDGLGWLDLVSDDLGGAGYALGAVNLCAAGFGLDWRGSPESQRLERALRLCPDPMVARHMGAFAEWADQALAIGGFHRRQRLYFVALADGSSGGRRVGGDEAQPGGGGYLDSGGRRAGQLVDGERARLEGLGGDGGPGDESRRLGPDEARPAAAPDIAGGLADLDDGEQRSGRGPGGEGGPGAESGARASGRSDAGQLAHANGGDAGARGIQRGGEHRQQPQDRGDDGRRAGGARPGPAGERGADADHVDRGAIDWLFCRDGFWRAVEAGTFPLVNADKARVGKLRAFGNGLDFETASAFSGVIVELIGERECQSASS